MEKGNEETRSILNLMKESRIYWQVRREVTSLLLKEGKANPAEAARLVEQGSQRDKLQGLISNCIQKSTRRLPIEKDPHPFVESQRGKWSEMLVKDFNNMAAKVLREEEYDEEDESVNYVYDCGSLLHFLAALGQHAPAPLLAPTRRSEVLLFPTGLLPVPDYQQLRSKYSGLLLGADLVGGRGREKSKIGRRRLGGLSRGSTSPER